MVRAPAVAGRFYAANPRALERSIEACYLDPRGPGAVPAPRVPPGPGRLRAIVAPHAGYRYSGATAAHAYAALAAQGLPETVVVVGPNHTGLGGECDVLVEGYGTPLGVLPVDEPFARAMLGGVVAEGAESHRYEHSVEVHVPFLQHLGVRMLVPVVMGRQDEEVATALCERIRAAGEATGRNVVVLASSDLSHHVPSDVARAEDDRLLAAYESGDRVAFFGVLRERNHSACGFGPMAVALAFAGPREVRRLAYGTSGDVEPMEEVVGYASLALEG